MWFGQQVYNPYGQMPETRKMRMTRIDMFYAAAGYVERSHACLVTAVRHVSGDDPEIVDLLGFVAFAGDWPSKPRSIA